MKKRLTRSTSDYKIAGVCGGLAQYFECDPTLIRIIFLLFLFLGCGLLAYIICWIAMPKDIDVEF